MIRVYAKDPGPIGSSLTVSAFVSVSNKSLCSALVTTTRQAPGAPAISQLSAVTVGSVNGSVKRLKLEDVLAPGRRVDRFAEMVALPELNRVRAKSGLAEWRDVPQELLANFVPTPQNIAWPMPPDGVARNSGLLKLPWAAVAAWLDPQGPLGDHATVDGTSTRVSCLVRWPEREPTPFGSVLRVSLLRQREDPLEAALSHKEFKVKFPPFAFEEDFVVKGVGADERLFLDIRLTLNDQTLFKNRDAVRVPVEGWQSQREIVLERERDR